MFFGKALGILASVAVVGATSATGQAAPIVVDFADNDAFDSNTGTSSFWNVEGNVGATKTYTNGTDTVAVTTVDIEAPVYDLSGSTPVPTSTIIKASSSGAPNRIRTNSPTGFNAIGVNSEQVTDTQISSESGQINYLEAWIFEFDQAVVLNSITVNSMGAEDAFEMTVSGVTAPFSGVDNTATANDLYVNPFNGLLIPTGADVTFRYTSTTGALNRGVRIDALEVSVPEPASLGLVGLSGIALLSRCRRRPNRRN